MDLYKDNLHQEEGMFHNYASALVNKPAAQAAGADPFGCNSTNR